jgi:hypothetical protein
VCFDSLVFVLIASCRNYAKLDWGAKNPAGTEDDFKKFYDELVKDSARFKELNEKYLDFQRVENGKEPP